LKAVGLDSEVQMMGSDANSGMLLHIRPQMLSPVREVRLHRLDVEPFGIRLFGGLDLMVGRPYPNKRYVVACRKEGKKAVDGIFVMTSAAVSEFSWTAEWLIYQDKVVRHHVSCKLPDREFGAASDHMMLWSATYGGWGDRRPEAARRTGPVFTEPVMELIPKGTVRPGIEDVIDKESGWIVERRQVFAMPTIERERLLCTDFTDRMPRIESAFRVGEVPVRPGFGTCMLCGRPANGWCGCSREPEL
jgi:hypothetical protein